MKILLLTLFRCFAHVVNLTAKAILSSPALLPDGEGDHPVKKLREAINAYLIENENVVFLTDDYWNELEQVRRYLEVSTYIYHSNHILISLLATSLVSAGPIFSEDTNPPCCSYCICKYEQSSIP